jgi:hypothetical protein
LIDGFRFSFGSCRARCSTWLLWLGGPFICRGSFHLSLLSTEPLRRDFFEYHAEAGVVDYCCPAVRLCKCADFLLTRYTRCTFYLFGRPIRFKLTLENHAVFPLLETLSNEFGECVWRVRSVGSLVKHVWGGGSSWEMASFVVWVSNSKSLTLQRRSLCSWPGGTWPKHRDSGVHDLKRGLVITGSSTVYRGKPLIFQGKIP